MKTCKATCDAFWRVPGPGPELILKKKLRCELPAGHESRNSGHVTTLPKEAGDDAGKMYVFPG